MSSSSQLHVEHADDSLFDARQARARRRRSFVLLGAAVVLAAGAYTSWWLLVGSRYVSTDNAYTAAELAEVTPAVGGIIAAVHVVDTQQVKRGASRWLRPRRIWRWLNAGCAVIWPMMKGWRRR